METEDKQPFQRANQRDHDILAITSIIAHSSVLEFRSIFIYDFYHNSSEVHAPKLFLERFCFEV